MPRPFLSSVTRISDLTADAIDTQALPRDAWATGDYVVGEVLDTRGRLDAVELAGGRMIRVMEGDLVVGLNEPYSGYLAGDTIDINGTPVSVQIGMNLTIVGSKELPKDE